jgi:tetratricopeptide (TPR) repeat protein
MKKKRNRWVYLVMGVMLFSLITVSALPLIGSVVEGQQFVNDTSGEIITFSQQELALLEAEALGYQKVLDRESNNETALNGLLEIKLKQKDLSGAIAPLATLAKLHPEQTQYTVLLAQAKQQLQDYEGAAAAYKEILAQQPGDIYALAGITNLYLAQDSPERAIALLKKTIQLATQEDNSNAARTTQDGEVTSPPRSSSIDREAVELLLGDLYAERERYGEAIALYDRLTQANEDDFRPILGKALVLEKQGDLTAAKPVLEKAYVAAPEAYKDRIGDEMERVVEGIKQQESKVEE